MTSLFSGLKLFRCKHLNNPIANSQNSRYNTHVLERSTKRNFILNFDFSQLVW